MAAGCADRLEKAMASHRGTIRPVSSLTLHSALCLHLETVSSRPRVSQRFYLKSAFVVLIALFCVSSCTLEAQSTFGSIRGTVQDDTGASIPETQVTLHSVDENTDRTVTADATNEARAIIATTVRIRSGKCRLTPTRKRGNNK